MDDRHVSDEVARTRWMVINAVRIAGVAMVLVGILGARGVYEYPVAVAYLLIVVGLFDIFAVPLLLARKWRSPPE